MTFGNVPEKTIKTFESLQMSSKVMLIFDFVQNFQILQLLICYLLMIYCSKNNVTSLCNPVFAQISGVIICFM